MYSYEQDKLDSTQYVNIIEEKGNQCEQNEDQENIYNSISQKY